MSVKDNCDTVEISDDARKHIQRVYLDNDINEETDTDD